MLKQPRSFHLVNPIVTTLRSHRRRASPVLVRPLKMDVSADTGSCRDAVGPMIAVCAVDTLLVPRRDVAVQHSKPSGAQSYGSRRTISPGRLRRTSTQEGKRTHPSSSRMVTR